MRWGADIDGEVYGSAHDAPWDLTTWDTFERHAGKRVSMIHYGQPFGSFDLNAASIARARGATPLVSCDSGGFSMSAIARGDANDMLDAKARALAAFNSVVWLRPWWEMNGNWYPWGRDDAYAAAWRQMVTRIRAIAPLARFVWCPNVVWDGTSEDLGRWYPGDDYVDWMGVDGYNWGGSQWKSAAEVFGPTMQKFSALNTTAPWMICEVACTENGGDKAAWISNFLNSYLPKHTRFKSFSWFNWNIAESGTRRDWQIESSPTAQAAFSKGIQRARYASP